MNTPRRAVQVRVTGRVQGVGFRWFVARAAGSLGVAGWVRNASDGAVEVGMSGPADRVEQLLGVVRRGPPHALVQSVVVDDLPAEENAMNADFEILP